MPTQPIRFVAMVSMVAVSAFLHAQQWEPIAVQARYRSAHGMVTDPVFGRPLMFGGGSAWVANRHYDPDSWRWNGNAWYRVGAVTAPPADDSVVMAADELRQRIVLVGLSQSPAQTWEFDGFSWLQRQPATAPSSGSVLDGAMTFDLVRGRSVLYHAALGETWEWDGTSWTQVITAHAPSSRVGVRLAFDYFRGRTVLFGGDDGSRFHVMSQETWEYDGVDWVQINTANAPSGRSEYAMAFDGTRGQMLLFGGRSNQILFQDTWIYDGVDWTNLATPTTPARQVAPNMAQDTQTGEILLVTGEDAPGGTVPRTWSWNGTDWSAVTLPATPSLRVQHALASDANGQVLLFGGRNAAFSGIGGPVFGDTWRLHGSQWQPLQPASAPSARGSCQIATDTARQRVVLFGGDDASTFFGDTWEWNGTTWNNVAATGPAPRSHGAMEYDAQRGVCVMYGGEDATQQFNDTWTWNGAAWSQLPTPVAPLPRADHAMAYDSARGLTFLFGGRDASFTTMNDLWQWNGIAWTQLAATTPPAPRFLADFTYDPDRAHFLLHGGDGGDDSWEWDGNTAWTQIGGHEAIAGADAATAWDPMHHRIVTWDGSGLWAATAHAADATEFGTSCGSGLPHLAPAGRPFLGNVVFGFDVTQLQANDLVVLAGSLQQGNSPLPGGCSLLLQNPAVLGVVIAAANGTARFAVPIPDSYAFQGVTLYFQAGAADANFVLSTANALRVTFGD
jgi:hypothetical protein